MKSDIEQLLGEITTVSRRYMIYLGSSHDWYHTLRVRKTALYIADKEGADRITVEIAALLHDVGRLESERIGGSHSDISASIAQQILAGSTNILGQDRIENIISSIKSHSYRAGKTPETLEGKVLSDADRIDALGTVGIARVFAYAGRYNQPLHPTTWISSELNNLPPGIETPYDEYINKLKKLPPMMYTATGKDIALSRFEAMQKFFEEYEKEITNQSQEMNLVP